jgi:hypothetical protein
MAAVGVAAAPALAAASGTVTATGSMHAGHFDATATLLPDGQVLIAGTGSPSAELYNPATGTWTATGSMSTAREFQSATLLHNGEVLVAGGNSTSGPVASAELYNPATGKFSRTGSMTAPRTTQGTQLLANGEVLVTADVVSGAFSELYNPATGTWSAAGGGQPACTPARECQNGATSTLLANGEVLVTGGYINLATTYPVTGAGAMLYNPATNTWASTGSMTTARVNDTATLLPDGQVLVAGGEKVAKERTTVQASAELYTP